MLDTLPDQSICGLHHQVEEGSLAVHAPASFVAGLSIDEAVKKGTFDPVMLVSCLSRYSVPSPRDEDCLCFELRKTIVGEDGQDNSPIA